MHTTVASDGAAPRHSATVRVTHWVSALAFIALLVTGLAIMTAHPRFYWGEVGNHLTEPLFQLPIPASRKSVDTGYDYLLTDRNGWGRAMHFQSAWILVFAGLVYVAHGLRTSHFRKELLVTRGGLRWAELRRVIGNHLRLRPPPASEAWTYNPLQRLTYLAVVFGLVPLMIWTGLAMSPAVTAAAPWVVDAFGGHQSARTIHFFGTILLALFLVVHVAMIVLAGFGGRMRAMITGRVDTAKESS